MASVSRDTRDGRWLARWRDPGGRQRKKSFARKVDAQRWLDQLRADQHRGQYVDPGGAKVKVATQADRWLAGLGHLKISTLARYKVAVDVHIGPTWGSWALGDIRHSDVAGWIARLAESGLKPGTIRQTHRGLSLILDSAVKDGLIARNAARGVTLPRQIRQEPRFLSGSEVAAMVSNAGAEATSIAVLAFTGLRFGELAGLRVKRVDMLRGRLVVAESVTEVGGRLVWSTPKTHQTRSVPFPRSLADSIERLTTGKGSEDLLFTAPEGGVLRLRNWRRRVFDPAAKAAGIEGVSPHDLRHTAASLAIAAGANVKAVQRMLGHASAAMTLDVYAGLFGDDLDAVAAKLDGLVPHLRHNEGDSAHDTSTKDDEKSA